MIKEGKETIYLCGACPLSSLITLLEKYLPYKYNFEYIHKMDDKTVQKLLQYSPTGIFPLLKLDDFYLSGTLPIIKYLLNLHPETKKLLLSDNLMKQSECDMWMNYLVNSLYPIIYEINMQNNGKKSSNQKTYNMAINDLMSQLLMMNDKLKYKTFLIDHQIMFPDLLFGCIMVNILKIIGDKNKTKIPNIVRLLNYVENIDEIKETFNLIEETKKECVVIEAAKKEEKKKENKSKKNEGEEQSEVKKEEGVQSKKGEKQRKNEKKEEKKDGKKEEKNEKEDKKEEEEKENKEQKKSKNKIDKKEEKLKEKESK